MSYSSCYFLKNSDSAFNLWNVFICTYEIESRIRVFKEIARAVRHSLTLKKIPKLLSIYIFFKVVRMINYLHIKGGVSAIPIPNTIMSCGTLHYKRHLGINIGNYFQVNEHEDPSNSQLPQTKGEILLSCRATNPESHLP